MSVKVIALRSTARRPRRRPFIPSIAAPNLTGVAAAASAGVIAALVGVNILGAAVTGTAGAFGDVDVYGVVVGATGSGVVGTVVAEVDSVASGVAGTGVANALGWPEVDNSLSGVAGTGDAGTLSGSGSSGNISLNLTGVGATGVLGTLAAEVDAAPNGTVGFGYAGLCSTEVDAWGIAGVAGSGAVNGLGWPEIDNPLVGVAGTGGVGTLAPLEIDNFLSGVAGASAVGLIGPSTGIVGAAGVGAAGTMAADIDFGGVAGVAGAGAAASVAGYQFSLTLPGAAGNGAVGILFAKPAVAPLGIAGTGAAGTLGPDPAAAPLGVAATGAPGSFAGQIQFTLASVAAAGAAGHLTADPGATLIGVAAVGGTSPLLFPGQLLLPSVAGIGVAGGFTLVDTLSLPGVAGNGVLGVAFAGLQKLSLIGVAGAGAAGAVGYFDVGPNLVGVAAVGVANDVDILINTPAGLAGWSDFVARDGAAYAQALADLLPTGAAWPRDPARVLMKVVSGLAQIWGDVVDAAAADLLQVETDPRATTLMLSDWERNFGLPDDCVAEPLTIGDRQQALVAKMTLQGGQSRQFFYRLARKLGYQIEIVEYRPYMCGVSRCGDTTADGAQTGEPYVWQCAQPSIRFYWKVKVIGMRVTWFRCGGGGGQCGIDPMCRIALATDLECEFNRYKPAQTQIVFDYSQAAPDG